MQNTHRQSIYIVIQLYCENYTENILILGKILQKIDKKSGKEILRWRKMAARYVRMRKFPEN